MQFTGGGNPVMIDTIIHPFNDLTRNNTNFRGNADQLVEFTGLTPHSTIVFTSHDVVQPIAFYQPLLPIMRF